MAPIEAIEAVRPAGRQAALAAARLVLGVDPADLGRRLTADEVALFVFLDAAATLAFAGEAARLQAAGALWRWTAGKPAGARVYWIDRGHFAVAGGPLALDLSTGAEGPLAGPPGESICHDLQELTRRWTGPSPPASTPA